MRIPFFAFHLLCFAMLATTGGCQSFKETGQHSLYWGDIDALALTLDRATNRLIHQRALKSQTERFGPPRFAIVMTQFVNQTSLFISGKSLQRAFENICNNRSNCHIIWGQNLSDEVIFQKLDALKFQSYKRAFEERQRLIPILQSVQLMSCGDESNQNFLLRVTWQDPQTRAEIMSTEIPLRLNFACFDREIDLLKQNL